MSTHSAECTPHNCLEAETPKRTPSMNVMCGRTLIRKTSLLRKIVPIARRSSFADRIIYKLAHLAMNERRNDLEIVKGRATVDARSNSDRSPLYDVRNHASCRSGESEKLRNDVFADDVVTGDPIGKAAGLPSRSSRQPVRLRPLGSGVTAFALQMARPAEAGGASEGWWAWEDLNFRPHAYQARALTN